MMLATYMHHLHTHMHVVYMHVVYMQLYIRGGTTRYFDYMCAHHATAIIESREQVVLQ